MRKIASMFVFPLFVYLITIDNVQCQPGFSRPSGWTDKIFPDAQQV
jgi:hypothetical protein